jgi:hypothetical protein
MQRIKPGFFNVPPSMTKPPEAGTLAVFSSMGSISGPTL